MIVVSFVDLQKISLFPKFGGCGSKIEPATPISILNFEWAWQAQFLSYTHLTLEKYSFSIDEQMILLPFLYISYQKWANLEKLIFENVNWYEGIK